MKTTKKPTIQNFHLSGVLHIHPEEALEIVKEGQAEFIDVREEHEISNAHIKGSAFLPMWRITEWLPSVQKEKAYIVICNKGIRSTQVIHYMMQQGYTNLANLDGGIEAWIAADYPYEAASQSG